MHSGVYYVYTYIGPYIFNLYADLRDPESVSMPPEYVN